MSRNYLGACRVVGATALCATALCTTATGQEYRAFETLDGRTMVAEVLETDAEGFQLRVPPGRIVLPYSNLADMQNSDLSAYRAQGEWKVWIASTASARRGFVSVFAAVSGVTVLNEDPGEIPADVMSAATSCDLNITCAAQLFEPYGSVWVVRTTLIGSEAVFETSVSGTEYTSIARADRVDPVAVGNAVYGALGLLAPIDAGPAGPGLAQLDPTATGLDSTTDSPTQSGDSRPTRTPRTRTAWSRSRVMGSSFVPLPGYTAFAQGDAAGGALALAAVLPVTAAWVGASGKSAQSTAEHVALSVGGFYLATVAANQVLGLRANQRALAASVVPVQGGAVISLVGTR